MNIIPCTAEHNIFRDSHRKFLDKEIVPHVEEREEAGIFGAHVAKELSPGLGFPPFEGGHFWYIGHISASGLVVVFESLEKVYGKRFSTSQILKDAAKSGRKFYEE